MGGVASDPGREPLPDQAFSTKGVPPLQRTSASIQLLIRIIRGIEWLNVRCAAAGNKRVYDLGDFPWAKALELEWRTIRRELDGVLLRKNDLPNFQDISTDVASITKDGGWKTFLLTAYGLNSSKNIALCPETWRLVQSVPGLKTAMFSIFEPGKHLPAHRGPYNGLLRLHLGLVVPEPRDQVAIRVDDEICHWEEGRVLIFDDAYEHEAWNKTDKVRVVLFIDFVKPLRFPANVLNWLVLNLAVFTPFVREGYENHRKWEQHFHGRG